MGDVIQLPRPAVRAERASFGTKQSLSQVNEKFAKIREKSLDFETARRYLHAAIEKYETAGMHEAASWLEAVAYRIDQGDYDV